MNVPQATSSPHNHLIEAVTGFTSEVLYNFARRTPSLPNTIIRNMLARSSISLISVHSLAGRGHAGDCWTIFRTMTDRLFHLHWLGERDEFQQYEEWSFIRQYEAQNRALSDPMVTRHRGTVLKPTAEQKARYLELKQRDPQWTRPRPEDAAKSIGLPFLYKFGYDYASTHVHPMANDGEDEFSLVTGSAPNSGLDLVVENAILVHTLILQEGMNRSSLRWARIVYEFVEAARSAIAGDIAYKGIHHKLVAAGPTFEWSAEPGD